MGEQALKATLLRIAQLEERARVAEIALKAARQEIAARDGMGTRYAEMYAEREGLLERLEELRGQVPRDLDADGGRGVRYALTGHEFTEGERLVDVSARELSEYEAEALAYWLMRWVRGEGV